MPSKRLSDLQARADAVAQVEQLRVETRDDVVTGDTLSQLHTLDFGASGQRATNNADKLVPMYHAYDGRVIRIPMYQVEDRLMRRFEQTSEIPREWWNKQVWLLEPSEAEQEVRQFQCRLSPDAPDEIKKEMLAAGLNANCRKRLKYGGFTTQFEADEHFRVKHPRRWRAYQTYMNQNASRSSGDRMAQAIEALTALAGSRA